jgi:tRNA-dihydrouridine synthase B
MTNDPLEFIFVANQVKKLGYKELNWNLGCPYPMVAKRKMGSGLIKDAQQINRILTDVYANIDITISVKIRLGYENADEIYDALRVLENHPVKNIAIHPRIGKQLYTREMQI